MTTRILPPAEWTRLRTTEAAEVWPYFDPRHTQVIVVEDDGGEIVGTWTLLTVVHAECLWIAPAYRSKASVARRLWQALRGVARQARLETIATAAQTDEVRALLAHVGATKLPGDHYVMRLPCQPQ